MDAGSFVLDCEGVRWAEDLGMQDYNSLESKGVALFGKDRWNVFEANNFSHGTLTIDNKFHDPKGHANIIRFSAEPDHPHAVIDLTAIFPGQATKVLRGFKVLPYEDVFIQDELSGLKPGSEVRWAMVTGAKVKAKGTLATLEKDGQEMVATLLTTQTGFEVIPASPTVPNDYDEPHPDDHILISKFKAPASGQLTIRVLLRVVEPGSDPAKTGAEMMAGQKFTPCEDWSAPLPP